MNAPAPVEAAALSSCGETLEDLYENAPAGYLTMAPDGVVIRANATLGRWLKLTDVIVGRRFQDLLTLPARMYFETHVGPLLNIQGSVDEVALDLRCGDGTVLPVLINAAARHRDITPYRVYRMTVFNAVERRRYERELLHARRKAEDAARAKSELLAMLGHDVATPLNGILSVVQLLNRPDASERQLKLIDILRRSSENLARLIDDILTYSRLEAEKLPLESSPFAIRELLQNLTADFELRAQQKNVRFNARADDDVPAKVYGDAGKILQVLMNLAANALKFTPQGEVAVAVRKLASSAEHATLEFAVTDTGIGIERADMQIILEEFTQANADIGLKYGGAGLGLAISRRLLKLMDSDIEISSVVGRGSSFSFALTLRLAEAP